MEPHTGGLALVGGALIVLLGHFIFFELGSRAALVSLELDVQPRTTLTPPHHPPPQPPLLSEIGSNCEALTGLELAR